jgi:exodeoxyribonuclease-3
LFRVTSFNLNGIRAATRKGWLQWAAGHDADVICLQEIKAQEKDLDASMLAIPSRRGELKGYFFAAQKPGYAGTAIYSLHQPLDVFRGFGEAEFDEEGRYIEVDLGSFSVISLYVPSGSSSEERLASKFRFMRCFQSHVKTLNHRGKPYVICADWNVAHREIDLKNWRANQRNPGFLPEERQWIGALIAEQGLVDVFRAMAPEQVVYTWWSNRGAAFANDVGWRLDYQLAHPALAMLARGWQVNREPRFSDHAPFTVDYAIAPG